jgi:hypothetical protein
MLFDRLKKYPSRDILGIDSRKHTAYTITAEKTVAPTAAPLLGSPVEPIIEW